MGEYFHGFCLFGLPKSLHGNIGIWMIVNKFSKQAHFILVKKTIKPHHMANLFIAQILIYHGFPKSVISNRGPRMTSLFYRGLFEHLGTKLNFFFCLSPSNGWAK